MNNIGLMTGALCLVASVSGQAQNNFETRNGPTTSSVYAQQEIDLMPGFETTTSGFEAKIMLPMAVAGRWSAPLRWTPYQRYLSTPSQDIPAGFTRNSVTGMIGIHTHVTPDGNVLSWEGHNEDTFANPTACTSHAYVWNPNTAARQGNVTYPELYFHYDNYGENIFCSGHSFLADGKLLIAGGHYSGGKVDRGTPFAPGLAINTLGHPDYVPPTSAPINFSQPDVNGYIGIRNANTFNYAGDNTNSNGNFVWQSQPPMTYRRWYPTVTTLGSGEVLVTSGQRYGGPIGTPNGVQALIPEVYNPQAVNPQAPWRQLTGAPRLVPSYPWMFLAPDGRVFNAGPNPTAKFLNPTAAAIGSTAAGAWDATTYATGLNKEREYGSAVMYEPGKILILGGFTPDPAIGVTNTAERIDLTEAIPQFQTAGTMQFARTHVNATLLPDGTVLATGGTAARSTSEAAAILPAELWTPPASGIGPGTWTTLNAMATPRLYHSTAVLLPDATVLTTGGGQGGDYHDQPNYEIFTPPYLCRGRTRPEISSAPQAVAYGQRFTINSPQASSIVSGGRVTLVRLSSVTHCFNMNQRFIELGRANGPAANEITLRVPTNRNYCPPGHYMLFLVDGNGTPSHASIIAIDGSVCTSPLTIVQTSPNPAESYISCSRTTTYTVSGGPPGSTYDWTVNGASSYSQGPASINVYTSASAPTTQVTVQLHGSTGCGASSALTSYFPSCSEAQ